MFEARLKIVLGVFGLALLVIVVRLIDLQIVNTEEYRRQAERALLYGPRKLPFVRGCILDRTGAELAADRPCWEVAVDYRVLAMKSRYLRVLARRLLRESADQDMSIARAEDEVRSRIDRMWSDLARFSGKSIDELHEAARKTCRRVERVRQVLEAHYHYEFPIEEERMAHPVVSGLDDQRQVAARQLFQDYPWAQVRASTYRWYNSSESLPHVLGQLGAVTGATLDADPDRDDPLARYLASETYGVSGVEYAAERRLRGRRGLQRTNREGETVESIDAVAGEDVTLTIRLDLQEALYGLMETMVPATPHPAGGTIVVLDVPTREVLAMVSYPGYDNNTFRQAYGDLARDTRRRPLRFRAVANQYAPGSIVKPLTCIAGLTTGKITLETTFDCRGYYYPETRSGRKCWRIHGTDQRMTHGPLTVSDAIAHSCNIFMYHTGELVGVQELCSFFHMAGVGDWSGINLREEVRGINPTPAYLASRGRSVSRGNAWNYAIGQGEVLLTPVQAANLMAVFASGIRKEINLIRDKTAALEWKLPVSPEHWRAIRSGLFRVTNEVGATAYRTAHFVRDGTALCGKTGSATVWRWAVSYAVPYTAPGGGKLIAIVPATRRQEAVERFEAEHDDLDFDRDRIEVSEYWPPLAGGEPKPTRADREHAWFVGYLQPIDHANRPLLDATPRVAFSVLVEFGRSGGRTAGPIAARVADTILDILGPALDPDAAPESAGP